MARNTRLRFAQRQGRSHFSIKNRRTRQSSKLEIHLFCVIQSGSWLN
ncbi:hypothetical protein [Gloeocapsa sp. PCC 7428]|nr:hypothetical protein [Gloeocapsa sp. PCC 7428]